MISTGWKIAIQTLSRKMQIFYIKMISFLFIMTCIDITIYNINENAFNNFCEVKNIIFYIITAKIILNEIKKTIKLLFKKLHYAQTLIPEFSEGLLFKINIFKQLKIIIFSYPIQYVIIFLIHLIIPDKYDSTCLKFVDYYYIDLILLIDIVIIFSPKTLPKNYEVDFAKDLEDDSGKIYRLTIEKNEDGTVIFNPLNKKEIMKIHKKKIPIIIFGPSTYGNNNIPFIYIFFIINTINKKIIFIKWYIIITICTWPKYNYWNFLFVNFHYFFFIQRIKYNSPILIFLYG